jgi:hypothetical protein
MKNYMKRYIIMAFAALFIFSSCERDDSVGGTATQDLAGEWWVQISVDNSLIDPGFYKVLTYNTSDNAPDKIWVDDEQNIFGFKSKVPANVTGKTFSGDNAVNAYGTNTISFKNGKIMMGVSKGPVSQAATDSIYFEAEFSDDPGTIYQFHGYQRTRYTEDDH